jgi:LAO/AO transport system kinase
VPEVWDAIREHRAWLESSGTLETRRAKRIDREVREIVVRVLERRAYDACAGPEFEELHERVHNRELDPYTAAQQIIDGI